MDIRNNLLSYLKKKYLQDLLEFYDEREAEQLLTIIINHFFGITRNELIMNPDYRLSESEILILHKAVKELKRFKPVQYITGVVEFHNLSLEVTPDVLIPRPETEELVQLIADNETDNGLIVLDIGTGSGCIAIGLSSLLNKANVYATDVSDSAISLAKRNSTLNNQKVDFSVHDILNNKESINDNDGKQILFDVIVSNPPYVTHEDKEKMHANVIDYEPHNALFVPENSPLLFYQAILEFSESYLKQSGRVYFEINERLGDELLLLLEYNNYSNIVILKDLQKKDRFITAMKL